MAGGWMKIGRGGPKSSGFADRNFCTRGQGKIVRHSAAVQSRIQQIHREFFRTARKSCRSTDSDPCRPVIRRPRPRQLRSAFSSPARTGMQSIVNHLLATERSVAKGHIVVAQSSQFSARDFASERGDAKAALVDATGVLDATQWARAHGTLCSIRLCSADRRILLALTSYCGCVRLIRRDFDVGAFEDS